MCYRFTYINKHRYGAVDVLRSECKHRPVSLVPGWVISDHPGFCDKSLSLILVFKPIVPSSILKNQPKNNLHPMAYAPSNGLIINKKINKIKALQSGNDLLHAVYHYTNM